MVATYLATKGRLAAAEMERSTSVSRESSLSTEPDRDLRLEFKRPFQALLSTAPPSCGSTSACSSDTEQHDRLSLPATPDEPLGQPAPRSVRSAAYSSELSVEYAAHDAQQELQVGATLSAFGSVALCLLILL